MNPDHEQIISKYATVPIDLSLLRSLATDPSADQITTAVIADIRAAADDIADTEADLARIADYVASRAQRVADDLATTDPRNRVSVHHRGELQAQGIRFDTLITARAERIRTLNTVLRLWRALPAVAATAPAPPPSAPIPVTRRSRRTR